MSAATRLMSLDEFLALPETEPYTELIDGVMCRKTAGKKRHNRTQCNLTILLATHDATRGGSAWPELGFRFPRTTRGNLRVPDVAYYLPGSLPDDDEDYPDRAPDLAAEVRSPGQSLASLRGKLAFLREQGTRCTLLVDPETGTVEVNDGGARRIASGDEEVKLEALNGFSFRMTDLTR